MRNQDRILVFNNLDTMNGNAAPLHIIEGDQTGLDAPTGLCLDPERGHLYSLNDTGRNQIIRVWHNAANCNGNVAPDRMIFNGAGLLDMAVSVCFLNE